MSQFVNIREKAHKPKSNPKEKDAIPITVRQLEAIIRLAEALAKMTLSDVATVAHVEEALRLFNVSTLQAASAGVPPP